MARSLAHVALVVRDYDEAIAWFTDRIGFELVADEYQPEQDKRWVLVAPSGAGGTSLLLARAATPEQQAFVGNQSGGRVFLFLRTDDFERDYEAMRAKGVRFVRPPRQAPYGAVAVFEDLYGNLWDLVQFARATACAAAAAAAPRATRMVPQFRVDDMATAVDFYTRILDFELAPGESVEDPVLSLVRGGVELMLTSLPGDQAERANAHLIVDDAVALFAHWRSRGLDQSHRTESPVHLGPVDQSWGTREFYVTDPSGNTLRVVQRRH